MRLFFCCSLFLFFGSLSAQQFQNPDLEGQTIPGEFSILPMFWEGISSTDPRCEATIFNVSDTADLTDETAPDVSIGTCGTPFSGATFVSGMYVQSPSGNYYHEGIKQTVDGFELDSFYTISLYQAVIKQNNVEDPTGRWMMFLDDETIPRFTTVSFSGEAYNSLNTPWDFRAITFQAYATSHTFYFLPYDNDLSQGGLSPGELGGVRMGIDSIYLRPKCQVEEPLVEEIIWCDQDSIVLSVSSPDATYTWQDGSTNPSFVAREEGYYNVIVRGPEGCLTYEEVNIIDNDVLALDLGPDSTLCSSDELIVLGQMLENTSVNYVWQDGSTEPLYSVSQTGTYAVEWELNGCVRSDTINILPSVLEAFSIGNDTTICQGDTLTFMAPPLHPSVSYNWQNGSTGTSLTVTGPTNVRLIANAGHCTLSDTVQVTSIFPSFSLGADQLICPGETVVLDASLPNTTYLWQDASTEPTYTAGSTGLYSVELSRGDCILSDTVAIEVFSTLTTNLGPDTTVCPGVFPLLSVDVPGASYVWSDQTLVNSTFAYEPGLYSVTVTIDGCEVVDSILVSEFSTALDWPDELYLCDGEMLTLDASEAEGTYTWQDGSTAPSYLVSVPGQYSVEIDGGDCQELFFVEVLLSTLSEFDLGNDTTLCSSEVFVINPGILLGDYAWSDGSNETTLTTAQGGLYWLEISQGNCYFRDSILLEYVALPDIEIGNDTTLCPGEVLSLQADVEPPISIQWSTGATTPSIVVETPGNYGVEIALDGCTKIDEISLNYYEATSLELGQNIIICEGQPLVLAPEISGPPATFLWQDGTSTPSYDVQNSGTYSLILTNICETATDEISVTIEDCNCEVYLPNAFSPNGDGTNDTFRSYTTCPITNYDLQIFDRWGGLRYTSNNMEEEWQGLEVNSGVYLYTLRYRDRDGQWQQLVGEVHLLR